MCMILFCRRLLNLAYYTMACPTTKTGENPQLKCRPLLQVTGTLVECWPFLGTPSRWDCLFASLRLSGWLWSILIPATIKSKEWSTLWRMSWKGEYSETESPCSKQMLFPYIPWFSLLHYFYLSIHRVLTNRLMATLNMDGTAPKRNSVAHCKAMIGKLK